MKATKKAKRNLIIIFSVSALLVIALLAIIIWQTVEVGKLNGEIQSLDANNTQQESLIAEQNGKIAYYESEQFKEDYAKYELGYTEDKSSLYK